MSVSSATQNLSCRELSIPGLKIISLKRHDDHRGSFVKFWHDDYIRAFGMPGRFAEEFMSVSKKNVIRGMHFQTPPHDHEKVVTCFSGRVLDVVVDLRLGSPTYKKYETIELSSDSPALVLIPKGIAHGFLALSDEAMMIYKVTTVHTPDHDAGIRYNSFGFQWPAMQAIVSDRDSQFISLDQFQSPFRFGENS